MAGGLYSKANPAKPYTSKAHGGTGSGLGKKKYDTGTPGVDTVSKDRKALLKVDLDMRAAQENRLRKDGTHKPIPQPGVKGPEGPLDPAAATQRRGIKVGAPKRKTGSVQKEATVTSMISAAADPATVDGDRERRTRKKAAQTKQNATSTMLRGAEKLG